MEGRGVGNWGGGMIKSDTLANRRRSVVACCANSTHAIIVTRHALMREFKKATTYAAYF